MKSLVMAIVFGALLSELCVASGRVTSGVHSYFGANSGSETRLYKLKYPVLSWSDLGSRRRKIDLAIANLDTTSTVKTLYGILENVAAIHSGLPRIVEGDAGYEELTFSPDDELSPADVRRLEESIVTPETWTQYVMWGKEVQQQIQEALGKLNNDRVWATEVPQQIQALIDGLPDGERRKHLQQQLQEIKSDLAQDAENVAKGTSPIDADEFFRFYGREFDTQISRTIRAYEGGRAPPFPPGLSLEEKMDMPILIAINDKEYKTRLPSLDRFTSYVEKHK